MAYTEEVDRNLVVSAGIKQVVSRLVGWLIQRRWIGIVKSFRNFEASVLCALGRWVVKTVTGQTDLELLDYLDQKDKQKFLQYLSLLGYQVEGQKLELNFLRHKTERLLVCKAKSFVEQEVVENRQLIETLLEVGVTKKQVCQFLLDCFRQYGVKKFSVQSLNKILLEGK